ncbi:hypothetical protein N0V83_000668 [Neocucurbitaria cava]|uniref:EthD domain-containing protein n=1 Tax=Neocucurbitaria cava TaxID=798079 RepID=A0A9W8YHX3_9PLEO|nr:hypothetical protein N0V83_000668 [Neocucurbitaria cava]
MTRRYLARINRKGFGGPANPDRPPLTLKGEMQGLDCDCIAEMNFDSEAIFQDFYDKRHEKDIAAVVLEDEKAFLEPGKTTIVVIGETWSTDQNGVSTGEVNYVSKDDRVDGGESPSEGSYVS